AVAQLQLALKGNVSYLDHGWQVLVDGLRQAAETAGVTIMSGSRITAIEHDESVRGVQLADGSRHPARAGIAAAPPAETLALVRPGILRGWQQWIAEASPVKAACLDLGLRRLPQPRATFALGVDQPLYLSVHSAVARLAPAGAATIHVAKYLH